VLEDVFLSGEVKSGGEECLFFSCATGDVDIAAVLTLRQKVLVRSLAQGLAWRVHRFDHGGE